ATQARRQMDPARIDQRIPGAARVQGGGAGPRRGGGDDGVPVTQVIDGPLVSGNLLAMKVGSVRDDLTGSEVPLDLQSGQIVGVRSPDAFRGCRVELPLPRV